MARCTGLRCGMSALGCMLLVYFMSVTGVSSQSNSGTSTVKQVPIMTVAATTSKTTPAATILPSASEPVPSASPTTKQNTVTQAPVVQPTTPTPKGRKFDTASFIGGIILGIVLTGIFIFAFKWWQSRNKSYHSL